MSQSRTPWKWNWILAAVAVLLAAVSIGGDPYRGHVVTLNTKELGMIVDARVDHVTAQELADRLIQGQTDQRILDLREPTSYAEYHIPTAENVVLGDLVDYPLYRNEQIVLYSDGGIHSAQAWFLLRAQGFQGVYMLLGGLDAWKDEVLFPSLPTEADPEEIAEFERLVQVSQFFGGSPRRGSGEEFVATPMQMPTVEPASQVPVAKKKKKRKEGC
jgi:rhodanese-related sulfurtransferase